MTIIQQLVTLHFCLLAIYDLPRVFTFNKFIVDYFNNHKIDPMFPATSSTFSRTLPAHTPLFRSRHHRMNTQKSGVHPTLLKKFKYVAKYVSKLAAHT